MLGVQDNVRAVATFKGSTSVDETAEMAAPPTDATAVGAFVCDAEAVAAPEVAELIVLLVSTAPLLMAPLG